MRIIPVAALRDNYAYLVVDVTNGKAVVVDPSEPDPVDRALTAHGVTLAGIWLTHHHWDHVGGVEALLDRHGDVPVLGSRYDLEAARIPRQTLGLGAGDRFVFAGREVSVLEIPGHTLGAIAYVIEGNVFSGDTLFLGGCGLVFEGTMEMMKDSLARLRALPDATRIWCGHEYTVRNLEFAETVEPGSPGIREALARARSTRDAGEPTVPGTIAEERETNPFFRFDVPTVAAGRDEVATFTALRGAKDAF